MYSVRALGADKATALTAIAASLAEVVSGKPGGQPAHAADNAAALAAATAAVGLLKDDATMDVQVDVSGGITLDESQKLTQVSVSVDASLKVR